MAGQNSLKDRLPLLDGLRGLAAVIVVLYHVQNVFGGTWFTAGYLAVDLFFMISGFILTLIAEPRIRNGLTIPRFFNGRLWRLWPTIAFGTCLGASVELYIGERSQTAIITMFVFGLFFVPAIGQVHPIFPLNGPQWSINMELLANLVHAMILIRLSTRTLIIFIALIAAALVAKIFIHGANSFGSEGDNWLFGSLRVAFSYSVGILVARKWTSTETSKVVGWGTLFYMIFGLIIALPFLSLPTAPVDAIMVTIVFPILFWLVVRCETPPPPIQKWMRYMGNISFPLYAVHMPLIRLIGRIENSPASAILAICLSLILACGMTWLSAAFARRIRELSRIRSHRGALSNTPPHASTHNHQDDLGSPVGTAHLFIASH